VLRMIIVVNTVFDVTGSRSGAVLGEAWPPSLMVSIPLAKGQVIHGSSRVYKCHALQGSRSDADCGYKVARKRTISATARGTLLPAPPLSTFPIFARLSISRRNGTTHKRCVRVRMQPPIFKDRARHSPSPSPPPSY
jgi:hypothetical protein